MIEAVLPAGVASAWCDVDGRPVSEAGRACAADALRRVGAADVRVGRGERGEPVWPDGFVGSITHKGEYAAAAAAPVAVARSIGIDAERDKALEPRVIPRVCAPEEIAWMAGAPPGVSWAAVLFSARESVYKAWFPLARRYLGYQDVVVTLGDGTFVARLREQPPVGVPAAFDGRFAVGGGLIVTAVIVEWESP